MEKYIKLLSLLVGITGIVLIILASVLNLSILLIIGTVMLFIGIAGGLVIGLREGDRSDAPLRDVKPW
jgi:hypothetical protein